MLVGKLRHGEWNSFKFIFLKISTAGRLCAGSCSQGGLSLQYMNPLQEGHGAKIPPGAGSSNVRKP
jgi:hypothetical protein